MTHATSFKVDKDTQEIQLVGTEGYKGVYLTMSIPFSEFKVSGNGTKPDFNQVSIIDYGQTLKLGEYESAVDVLNGV